MLSKQCLAVMKNISSRQGEGYATVDDRHQLRVIYNELPRDLFDEEMVVRINPEKHIRWIRLNEKGRAIVRWMT